MKPSVYIETSFVSYLTGRPSRDIVIAGHQQITRDWWETQREHFELFASQLVVREARAGDPAAAQERMHILSALRILETTAEAISLAEALIAATVLPLQAAEDALHIAIAGANGHDYLLTWNCKHLANAARREQIQVVCQDAGYRSPIICTPEELSGV